MYDIALLAALFRQLFVLKLASAQEPGFVNGKPVSQV